MGMGGMSSMGQMTDGSGMSMTDGSEMPVIDEETIKRFVEHWGLDTGAEQMLLTADPSRAYRALTEFVPKEGTTNVTGKFISFFTKLGKSGGPPGMSMAGMGGGMSGGM